MTPEPLALPAADDALEWVATRTRDGLATARELVDSLRAQPPAGTIDLLRRWDEVARQLSNVAAVASLLANVHPSEGVRTACEQAEQEVDRYAGELQRHGVESVQREVNWLSDLINAERGNGAASPLSTTNPPPTTKTS